MSNWDLESVFKNLDDRLSVRPWLVLTESINKEIDDDIFSELVRLSKEKLGQEYDKIQREKDRFLYFDTLEKKYKEDVSMVLENLFEHAQTHVCAGHVKISEKIKEYRRLEELYSLPCGDGNFVGREQLLKACVDCLQADRNQQDRNDKQTGTADKQPVGVVLCGLSGMGKTSLAEQVCNKLRRSRPPWDIVYINQRGKCELKELCADLIKKLPNTSTEHDPVHQFREEQDGQSLQKQAQHLIGELCTNGRGKRVLLWLDDMDGHCDTVDRLKDLSSFLDSAMRLMHRDGHTRLLITVARKLGRDSGPILQNMPKLGEWLKEIEVTSMTPAETEQIIRQNGNLPDKDITEDVCEKICSLCCGSPIAIRSVADLLREGCKLNEIMGYLKCNPGQALVVNQQLSKCISRSLEKLDIDIGPKECKGLLVQLSMFQSAEFDLDDAFAVSHDTMETEMLLYMKDVERSKLHIRLIEFKAWHLLESRHQYRQSGKESHQYSLHPLVRKYLETAINEFKELKFAEEQAKSRFLMYFYQKIQEFAMKQDKTPVRTKFRIEDKWVHIKQFYEILLNESDTFSVFDLTSVGHKMSTKSVTLQHNRLWKIAYSVLHIEKRKTFANKQALKARARRNVHGYVFWTCMEAENLMQQDKKELAAKILDEMTNEIGDDNEGGVQNAKFGFRVHDWEWPTIEIVPVYAAYCATRGKLLNETKLYERALEYLNLAEYMLEGHVPYALRRTGKERVSKREVRNERAKVENLIGVVYFNKGNFDKSRDYHEKAYETIRQELQENVKWHEDYTEYLSNLATTYHQQGLNSSDKSVRAQNFRQAIERYNKCIETDKMMKRDMTFAHGCVLGKRAEIFYLQDDYERAIVDQKKGLTTIRNLFRPPNIHITLASERLARYYFKLGKLQKQQQKLDEKDKSFKEALDHFDSTLSYIVMGGLPKDHNNHRTYRIIKEKHLELLSMMKKNSKHVEKKYRAFEEGRYDKQIEQDKMDDFNPEEFLKKHQEEETEFELIPCSDSEDSSDESASSSPSSSSSYGQEFNKRPRLDSGIEVCRGMSQEEMESQNREKGQYSESMKATEGGFGDFSQVRYFPRRESSESAFEQPVIDLGMGSVIRQQSYRDTNITSQESAEVEYRVKDRSTHRPSVRDSGMGDSEEQDNGHRRQLVRQSSVDLPSSSTGRGLSEDSSMEYPEKRNNSPFLSPQRPVSSSVIRHTSQLPRKRSLEAHWGIEQPGTSTSTEDRRRSWLSASTGSGGSAEDRRMSWGSTGSQDSVTTQFRMFTPFRENIFHEEAEDEPERKRVKSSETSWAYSDEKPPGYPN